MSVPPPQRNATVPAASDPRADVSGEKTPHKLNFRVLFGSISGSIIEWFDFLVYGTLAALVFNKIYFPNDNAFVATILSYVSFSLTFFFRPLGGIIFSHIGDRIGRKKTLFITLCLMGGGTVAIGLLPDYNTIGIWAPILLCLCRIMQGLGIGGEWGGALLLAYEYAPRNRRGLYGAVPQMGISLGMLLASAVVALLTLMPSDLFMSWGWRIPFVGSIILVVVGLWIRNGLDDTPEFRRMREQGQQLKLPIKEVATKHWGAVLVSISAKAAETGPFYIFGTYVVAYATDVDVLNMRENHVLLAVAAAAFVATIWMPIFGRISDSMNRGALYRTCAIATIVLVIPYYLVLNTGHVWALFAATIFGFGILWGSVNAILGTLIAENFAPQVRYTGASLGYQLGAAIFGGSAPLIAVWLFNVSGGQWWPIAGFVALCCLISVVGSFFIRHVSYNEDEDQNQNQGSDGVEASARPATEPARI